VSLGEGPGHLGHHLRVEVAHAVQSRQLECVEELRGGVACGGDGPRHAGQVPRVAKSRGAASAGESAGAVRPAVARAAEVLARP